MVDRVKIFLSSNLITMQNLVAVSHTASVHEGGPKHFRDVADAPPHAGFDCYVKQYRSRYV